MRIQLFKLSWLSAFVVFAIGFASTASAHLMVAQRGTLNFTHKGVYMVLSLPASAFTDTDSNSDQQMQQSEFIDHRLSIIETIKNDVLVYSDDSAFAIEGMMLTPVNKEHDADHTHDTDTVSKAPADADVTTIEQIIVMGRFPVTYSDKKKLSFGTSLLGQTDEEQLLTVVAKLADKSKSHEFEIRPDADKIPLFVKKP